MKERQIPVSAIATPAVIVYLDVLEANIASMSRLAREAGVRLRPHTKIHECPDIAKMQIAGGACGIEVGAIERALCMADAGIDDILIAHPFYGDHKLAILRRLLDKPGQKITVMVDMMEQAEGISLLGKAIGRAIPTLLKVNTGGDRFGVRPGEPALRMAKQLCRMAGIDFQGIYVHESGGKPTREGMDRLAIESATMAVETARLFLKEGIPVAPRVRGGLADTTGHVRPPEDKPVPRDHGDSSGPLRDRRHVARPCACQRAGGLCGRGPVYRDERRRSELRRH